MRTGAGGSRGPPTPLVRQSSLPSSDVIIDSYKLLHLTLLGSCSVRDKCRDGGGGGG